VYKIQCNIRSYQKHLFTVTVVVVGDGGGDDADFDFVEFLLVSGDFFSNYCMR
jgi:hypothetical protein